MWINTETKKVYNDLMSIRVDYPLISFPEVITDADLAPFDIVPVRLTPKPDYNRITQNIIEKPPVYQNDDKYVGWVQVWKVTAASQSEIAEREGQAKYQNKLQAEKDLQETDWTQSPDVDNPENPPYLSNKAEFTSYRAELRVIAINPPVTVETWPARPNEQWVGA
jgi:hypothetical protein